jgi:outer membrane protein OmpA-like peptidoglycan-associated protein
MIRPTLATAAGLAALLLAHPPSPAAAAADSPDHGLVCNPVQDAARMPVLTGEGRFVRHGGTIGCPQPEPAAAPVAAAPPPAPPVKITIANDVAFEFDKSELRPDFLPELDAIVADLRQAPEVDLVIEGHADALGDEGYNQNLSERRATAVATYLARQGLPAERLQIVGKGELEPVASNDSRDGRAQNRRVEIRSL